MRRLDYETKGIFYTILSAVSFGIMPLLCSQAYDLGANAETLVFLRNVFAIMILFVLMKLKHISFAISRKDFKNTALVGIFGITLTALLLYNAYSYISLGTATTLHFLYPAFVALINYVFYKEHLAKSTVLVLLAATLGIFFFFEPGNGNSSNRYPFSYAFQYLLRVLYDGCGAARLKSVKFIQADILSGADCLAL